MLSVLAGLRAGSAPDREAQEPLRPLDDETRAVCQVWLRQSGVAPEDYVVAKFAEHDLILLGETHEVRENCEFVAALVPFLHRSGVRTLCSEFVCSRYNARLEGILNAPDYDEAAVVDLFRGGPWPTWGYREYLDIVRAVWAFNRSLPAGAARFRLVGLDSDWKQSELLTLEPAARMKRVLAREEHLTAMIEREVFGRNEKALVHIGFAHTVRQGKRVAAVLAARYGPRVFQVALHHEMPGVGGPGRLTGFVEDVVAGTGLRRVGFDVPGTPFGALRDEQGQYFQMLGRRSTFRDFAEGYVVLKPVRELTPVTWVQGFIVPQTFEEAKTVAEKLRWVGKDHATTPEALEAALAARLARRKKPAPAGEQAPR